MSIWRRLLFLITAGGLAVLLAAEAVPTVSSAPVSQALNRRIYMPVIRAMIPAALQGTVTNNNAAASGETILLMVSRDGGVNFSVADQTVTDASGAYQFSVPVLRETDQFYAYWKNASSSSSGGKLWSFSCAAQTRATLRRCDFDIHDVPLVAPYPGEQIYFPYTFIWTPRIFNTDNYAVTIYDDQAGTSLHAFSNFVGYTDRVTMPVAPPNSATGKSYFWSVRVVTPSGTGEAYGMNPVYYNDLSSLGVEAAGTEWQIGEGGR